MNAFVPIDKATSLNLPGDISFEDWLEVGRDLAAGRRRIDWLIGDWLSEGRQRFNGQAEFEFLSEALGVSERALTTVAKAVRAFPPHCRDAALTIEHHAHAAALPEPERLPFLTKARREHWTPEQARVEVIKLRVAVGDTNPLPREDPDYDAVIAIVRAWNRAQPHVRQSFMELATEAKFGVIDA